MTPEPHTLAFATTFPQPPALLADIQTSNEGDAAVPCWRDLDQTAADLWVHGEQAPDGNPSHLPEAVGYLLLESAP